MLITKSSAMLGLGICLSLLLHLVVSGFLATARRHGLVEPKRHKPGIVQVKIKPVEPPAPQPPPAKKLKPPQPTANLFKQDAKPVKPVKPIQGLTQESTAKDGTGGVHAPVGNTLMIADDGTRVGNAMPLTADLSADPKLIPESVVVPSYTDAALDAGLEGRVTIEVYVDESGAVTMAEPLRKMGYGMDEKILQSSYSAKFIPRKNHLGQPEPGWTKITFNLQVP